MVSEVICEDGFIPVCLVWKKHYHTKGPQNVIVNKHISLYNKYVYHLLPNPPLNFLPELAKKNKYTKYRTNPKKRMSAPLNS